MNTRIKITIASISALALAASAVIPAFAQTSVVGTADVGVSASATGAGLGVSASASASSTARIAARQAAAESRMQKEQANGDQEITARIASLNALIARIQGLKNVSDSEKTSIQASLQTAITDMNDVQAKLAVDTSTTTLKADMQSITQDYRVYALVIPQADILAATDRVNTIVAMMDAIQTKIEARISAMPSIPSSVTTAMTDLTAKLSDASTQVQASVSETSSLMPDQGDQTVMASNTAALKDARAKIKAAADDLTAARADIKTAIQAIIASDKSLGASGSTSASASASASTTSQ